MNPHLLILLYFCIQISLKAINFIDALPLVSNEGSYVIYESHELLPQDHQLPQLPHLLLNVSHKLFTFLEEFLQFTSHNITIKLVKFLV